jgi:SelR domain
VPHQKSEITMTNPKNGRAFPSRENRRGVATHPDTAAVCGAASSFHRAAGILCAAQRARPGTFRCVGCAQPLLKAERKFESGTEWPSFFAPLEGAIETTTDRSFGMARTDAHRSQCGGHLGHVFARMGRLQPGSGTALMAWYSASSPADFVQRFTHQRVAGSLHNGSAEGVHCHGGHGAPR